MLQVDLRELARGPVDTQGQLAGNDPLFEGLDGALAEPVRVAGRLQAAGEGRFYWRASLRTRMAGQCRRCLAAVTVPVVADVDALFSQDPDALEDPSSYPLARDATAIDLCVALREELLLALPQWVVCRDDCRGLGGRGGAEAPRVEVEGAVQALREFPPTFRIQLVGRTRDIEAALKPHGAVDRDRLEIVEAPEVVGMGEKPLAAVKSKPRSSV